MKKHFLIILILCSLVLSACAASSQTADSNYAPVEPQEAPAYEEAEKAAGGFSDSTGNYSPQQQVERIVIKNASLSLAVADPQQSMETISAMADEMGGFTVSARVYQSRLSSGIDVPRASVTIRVPAERLNEALERIRQETTQPVINENLDSQDVTREYVDLSSRLRNLQATEIKLQEFMEAAEDTEAALNVYNELVRVREQIEVIQGQIQYYEQAAALSAIEVDLLANEAVQPITIGGWQPAGVARDAIQTLVNALKGLANIGIWTVLLIIPLLVVVLLPIFIFIRIVLSVMKRSRRKPLPPTA